MQNIEVIHNFTSCTESMIEGLSRVIFDMSDRLNDPAERSKFEEWERKRGDEIAKAV